MKRTFIIDNVQKIFYAAQIGANEYRITVLDKNCEESHFKVALQPTGDDKVLPTFQLFPKNQGISKSLINILPDISDWLIEESKAN